MKNIMIKNRHLKQHLSTALLIGVCATYFMPAFGIDKPSFVGDTDIKEQLDDKAGAIFDIIIYAVVALAALSYAVAGGCYATAQPDKGKMIGISTTIGLVFITVVGGVVSLIL